MFLVFHQQSGNSFISFRLSGIFCLTLRLGSRAHHLSRSPTLRRCWRKELLRSTGSPPRHWRARSPHPRPGSPGRVSPWISSFDFCRPEPLLPSCCRWKVARYLCRIECEAGVLLPSPASLALQTWPQAQTWSQHHDRCRRTQLSGVVFRSPGKWGETQSRQHQLELAVSSGFRCRNDSSYPGNINIKTKNISEEQSVFVYLILTTQKTQNVRQIRQNFSST